MDFEEVHALQMFERIIETRNFNQQITLISGKDGKRISICRVILVAASKYFETMLGSDFDESKQNEFILKQEHDDGETIQTIVDFCYTGRIELTTANVDKFIEAAAFYQIDLLQQSCCDYRCVTLNASNAIDTLLIADKFSLPELRQRSFEFVCASLDIIPSADILQINHQLLRDLLISDTITVPEEFIFVRLMDWYEHKNVEREKMMPTLLQCVRLNYITSQFLDKFVAAVYRKFNCLKLVVEEQQRRALDPSAYICRHRSQRLYLVFRNYNDVNMPICLENYNFELKRFQPVKSVAVDGDAIQILLYENKLITLGSHDNGQTTKSVVSIDLDYGVKENLPEMQYAREHFTAIVCEQYIYVIGGYEGAENALNLCERFNAKTMKWEAIKPMNGARYQCAAVVMDGCVIVAGGAKGGSSVEKYDSSKNEWINLAAMNKARRNIALVNSRGVLYAMGDDQVVEKYDSLKNEWHMIGSFRTSSYVSSVVSIADTLFTITKAGQFGNIKIDGDGLGPFEPLLRLTHQDESRQNDQRKLFLIQN